MLCGVCGSIDIVRARARTLDKLIRVFTGKNVFACRRCGWRGRRTWTEEDRVDRSHLAPDNAVDPKLIVLDDHNAG